VWRSSNEPALRPRHDHVHDRPRIGARSANKRDGCNQSLANVLGTRATATMKTVVPGYIYELASHKPNGVAQVLEFVHKSATAAGEHTLQEVDDGTTTEEVIMVLMDRLTFLNAKLPSAHNSRAISNLRRALDELHARTTDRVKRGVEGTSKR
jgi:hypothetical protein